MSTTFISQYNSLNRPTPIPCTVSVHSDWGQMEIVSDGAVIMKDVVAEKAQPGIYDNVTITSRKIHAGEGNYKFISKDIP
jgi:hypothetical protein